MNYVFLETNLVTKHYLSINTLSIVVINCNPFDNAFSELNSWIYSEKL